MERKLLLYEAVFGKQLYMSKLASTVQVTCQIMGPQTLFRDWRTHSRRPENDITNVISALQIIANMDGY